MPVYVSGWAEHLLREYFGQCGILEDSMRQIQGLPLELSRRLGMDVSFWERVLSNPDSRFHRLNLLDGAIEKVVRQAEENARMYGRGICHYLGEALYRQSFLNWVANYLRAMFEAEGYERLL